MNTDGELYVNGSIDDDAGTLYLTDGILGGTGSIAMSKFIFGASSSGTDDLTVQDLTITVNDFGSNVSYSQGGGTKTFNNVDMTVEGDLRLSSGNENFILAGGSEITVASGGLLDLEDADGINVGTGGGKVTVLAGGTLDRSTNTGDTAIHAEVDLAGTLTVQSGKLELAGGGLITNSATVSSGAILELSGSNAFAVDAALNLGGAGTTLLDAATVNVTGAFAVLGSHTLDIATGDDASAEAEYPEPAKSTIDSLPIRTLPVTWAVRSDCSTVICSTACERDETSFWHVALVVRSVRPRICRDAARLVSADA